MHLLLFHIPDALEQRFGLGLFLLALRAFSNLRSLYSGPARLPPLNLLVPGSGGTNCITRSVGLS